MKDKDLKRVLKDIDEVSIEGDIKIPDMSAKIKEIALNSEISQENEKFAKPKKTVKTRQKVGIRKIFALTTAGAFLMAITFGLLIITGVLFSKPEDDPGQTPGLEYRLIAGQRAYEVSIGTSTEKNIVVASEYNNLPVRQIAKDGFINAKIESIFMPDSIIYIDTNGELERGAFFGCESLTSVILSKNITLIGNYVFYGCVNLEKIVIPNSVKSIGVEAFGNCPKLKTIEIPDSTAKIGRGAFSGTLWYENQEDGIVYAGKIIYDYKGTMQHYTVLNNLREDTIGIADGAFKDCAKLTRITIPKSVKYIGNSAFLNCIYLKSIEIPENVASIGYSAFEKCLSLESVVIPEGIKIIESYTFSGCSDLKKVVIPYSVTVIKSSAFMGCLNLKSIVLPNSIKSIEWRAFMDCISLETILVPDGVEYISDETFRNCSKLKSIIIPKSLIYIGYDVFRGCDKNELTIYIRAESLPFGLNNPDLWNPEQCPVEWGYMDA